MEEERNHSSRQRSAEKERNDKLKNFGKTNVINRSGDKTSPSSKQSNVEDVDFEEIS